ncbi:DUF6542 domain-containing protein [Rhodococcus sp. TAF43]|uniref:DUF6542 domain-containing protein n=1 Tax=Rhodococcus sp. TAF43 TaxID=3237483 RepID=UPI003F986CC8
MSATQRARSGVPLDQRSALPTIPGIPAWGAVAVAAGLTFLGFAFDGMSGNELTSTFSTMYFLGCVLAVLAVRQRGLFTAVVQPPLLLFVAVPIGQQVLTDNAGTGLKDLAFNVAIPLVNRFPLMLAATVVVALIAGARTFLVQQSKSAPARSRGRRTSARPARTEARTDRRDEQAPAARRSRPRRDAREPDREPIRDPRVSRPSHDPATAHAPSYSSTYAGPDQRRGREGYHDPVPREPIRHEPIRREPVYRDTARRENARRDNVYDEPIARNREPLDRDPIPVRTARPVADAPAHPMPQVRYRQRREPPIDQ